MLIWLLASSSDNCLPADPEWITKQIGCEGKIDLTVLIDAGFLAYDASRDLAECQQDACLEAEAEAERETEAKARKPRRDGALELVLALEAWEHAGNAPLNGETEKAAEGYRVARKESRYPVWGKSQWLSVFDEGRGMDASLTQAFKKAAQSPWRSVHPKVAKEEAPIPVSSPEEEAENMRIHEEFQ